MLLYDLDKVFKEDYENLYYYLIYIKDLSL